VAGVNGDPVRPLDVPADWVLYNHSWMPRYRASQLEAAAVARGVPMPASRLVCPSCKQPEGSRHDRWCGPGVVAKCDECSGVATHQWDCSRAQLVLPHVPEPSPIAVQTRPAVTRERRRLVNPADCFEGECVECGASIPATKPRNPLVFKGRGTPRSYCGAACRKRASRARAAGDAERSAHA